jgi:hypothetical protein
MRQPIWRLAIRTKFNDVRYWHLTDVDGAADQCPLSGVKQTSQISGAVSANDPKRTWGGPLQAPGVGT